MLILAIDPSSISTGYALIRFWKGRCSAVYIGSIKPPRRMEKSSRLRYIYDYIRALVENGKEPVDGFAIESGYVGRNAYTSLLLGEVRGVCLAAFNSDQVVEVEPAIAKLCVTADGHASKGAVRRAVRNMLDLDEIPGPDEADAAAVAIAAKPELEEMKQRRLR